jgi:iron complex outermembrane recepter protein
MRSVVNCRWAAIAVLMMFTSAFAQDDGADDLDFLLTPEQGQPPQSPSPDEPAAVPEAEEESGQASSPPSVAPAPEPGLDTAAGAAAEPAKRRPSSRLVEEIIVTAQKREENLQNVPITVQAFSAERLDAMGITTQEDLPLVTPGMTVTNTSGFSIVYIRGVGSDTFLMGDLHRRGLPTIRCVAGGPAVRARAHRSAQGAAGNAVRSWRQRRRGEHHHQAPIIDRI